MQLVGAKTTCVTDKEVGGEESGGDREAGLLLLENILISMQSRVRLDSAPLEGLAYRQCRVEAQRRKITSYQGKFDFAIT